MPSGHSAILNGANGNGNVGGNPLDVPIDGWRAMLSIVLKARKRSFYGAGRNGSIAGPVAAGGVNGSTESFVDVDQEMDRVEVMVEGVKKRGVSFFLLNTSMLTMATNNCSRVCRVKMF